ncbi:hypothetical protein ACIQMR_35715 [Streptomyces sp. NPDC091376]|uniref:hypothetical protein n=1 Tax=Streptomyces sp. NPDC091376 TaxID=3365994 RepID=UPI0038251D0C
MPDRRRRTALRLPLSVERGSLLLRERQSTEPKDESNESNPFAPPPEGSQDRPWQPRRGSGDNDPGQGSGDDSDREGGREGGRSSWGSQWSSRQPGRSSGGFGGRTGGQNSGTGGGGGGQGSGPEGGGSQGTGLRWDPTDPVQRRARYALLSGMWAFFFALFDFPEIALLLGALAIYWGASSLRSKSRRTAASTGDATSATPVMSAASPAPAPAPASASERPTGRPQVTAAVSGLVMAGIALTIVAMTFTMQLVYKDFYTCVSDSLTKTGQLSCNELLPEPLRGVIGVKE